MGTSTNAVLFFGFSFFDSDKDCRDDFLFDPSESWEEYYASKKGLVDTSGLFNSDGSYAFPERSDEFLAREKIWQKYRDDRDALCKNVGVEIDSHCSGDYPIWYVRISEHKASRGSETEITLESLEIEGSQIKKLREFCEIMGITWKEPKWILASYWG